MYCQAMDRGQCSGFGEQFKGKADSAWVFSTELEICLFLLQ